jgi:hypothetical protein
MLELITANIAGKTRREIFNGREHIVAPLSLIVPGVLNGSNGPLFYPHEELSKEPTAWNHIPIVLYHPTAEGKPISARNSEVLNKSQLGIVLHASMNGKLTAEGWFDVDYTKSRAPSVFNSLEQGKPVELSTGLMTDTIPEHGEHKGVKYTAVARNYRPDHLAILPDQVGACSIKDGCGVFVNQMNKESDMTKKTDAQRKEIADFMISNCECWVEADREVLNAMTDEKLDALRTHVEKVKQAEAVANAVKQGFEHGDVGFTFNEKTLKFEGQEKPKPKKEEPVVTNKEEPAAKKPVTAGEWMAAAPPEIQSVVRNALAMELQSKMDLTKVILANKANLFKEDQLLMKPVSELQAIAALAKVEEVRPSYFGASVPVGNQQKSEMDENDFLPLPTINWSELAKQQRSA